MLDKGEAYRNIFEFKLKNEEGISVTIYKDWNTDKMSSIESKAIKQADAFELSLQTDINTGDVVQLSGSRSFWKVVDIDEHYQYRTMIKYIAKIIKIDNLGNKITLNSQEKAIFNAPIYGSVQIGGQNNSQDNTVPAHLDKSSDEYGASKEKHGKIEGRVEATSKSKNNRRFWKYIAISIICLIIFSFGIQQFIQVRPTSITVGQINSSNAAAFRIDNQNASAGQTLTVPIHVDTVGNEVGYTFSIAFDPTVLTNPQVTIGNCGGDVIFNNTNPGQIGFSVTSFSSETIPAGINQVLVNVTFTVATTAPARETLISFTDTIAHRKASGTYLNNPIKQPSYTNGAITIR